MALLVEDGQEQIIGIICSLPETLQQRNLTAGSPRSRLQTRANLRGLAAEPLHEHTVVGAPGVRKLELRAGLEQAIDAGDRRVRDLHKSAKSHTEGKPQTDRKTTLLQGAAIAAGNVVAPPREAVAAHRERRHSEPLHTAVRS
jgi:hypothetical protein